MVLQKSHARRSSVGPVTHYSSKTWSDPSENCLLVIAMLLIYKYITSKSLFIKDLETIKLLSL
jgi:hypothetical protein